jgi:ATP-dependent Lon protease
MTAASYHIPTYVVDFLLGRYRASTNEDEICEGLTIVEQQFDNRTVQSGKEEIFKARALDVGSVKFIDIVNAKLGAKNDFHVAEMPILGLKYLQIKDLLVKDHERMLTPCIYAEVSLAYDVVFKSLIE